MSSKQVKYALRRGVSIGGVNAKTIVGALEKVAAKNDGELTAKVVVDAARPESSSLHPVFEWDDAAAGEKYRLHQAGTVIRAVQIIDEATEVSSPIWVNVPNQKSDAGSVYMPVAVVINRPDLYMEALKALQKRVTEATDAVMSLMQAAHETDQDADRMACIGIASQAMQAANSAVLALH